jgi:hypothetical protein
MSDVKDPAIKLFGRTILAADEVGGLGSDPPPDSPIEEPDKVRGTLLFLFFYLGSFMCG